MEWFTVSLILTMHPFARSDRFTVVIFTIPTIYMVQYGESIGIAGLHYISFGIGLSVAAQVNSRMLDKLYKILSARNGGVGKPEFRLRMYIHASWDADAHRPVQLPCSLAP